MNDDKSGHRQRLRNKFTDNPSALNETELLEMILFYAIPVRMLNLWPQN